MDAKTRAQLQALNRDFYAEVADDFDATRSDPWPGWARAIGHARARPGRPLQVLDIGCGNGRLIDAIAASEHEAFAYLGIDLSEALLERARTRYAAEPQARFEHGDALAPDAPLPEYDPGFDLIALFGVLHHVPGRDERRALLARLVDRLRPAGVLAVAAWQFADRERFRKRMVSLDRYNARAEHPIDPAQLESGDHLLRFGDARNPRYCHHCDDSELRALFSDLPVRFLDAYESDGKTNDLNLYAIVERLG